MPTQGLRCEFPVYRISFRVTHLLTMGHVMRISGHRIFLLYIINYIRISGYVKQKTGRPAFLQKKKPPMELSVVNFGFLSKVLADCVPEAGDPPMEDSANSFRFSSTSLAGCVWKPVDSPTP